MTNRNTSSKMDYDVRGHLTEVRAGLPDGVRLVAISKYHPNEYIEAAYAEGQRIFGESHEQELRQKHETLPKDIEWHFIGHLQTNKVKYIIDKVDLIHSVDSMKLAQEIEKRAGNADKTMDILVQVNSAEEESKFGVGVCEAEALIADIKENCPHINIKGLMCIAPLEEDPENARPFFRAVKEIFDRHKDFTTLSMGMSNDFEVAIEEGSTAIRVGTAIFGNRDYRSEEK